MQTSAVSSSSIASGSLRRLGRAYEDTRSRIVGLLADLDESAIATTVPACPDWSVHDVAAHLAGLCTDIVGGNVEGAATDEWTGAQVEARRDWDLGKIVEEWDEAGPQVASIVDDFPGWYGRQVVADVATHEHDIRGTLGIPGARDSEAVAIGVDFLVEIVLGPALETKALGPLAVHAGDWKWTVGRDGPAPVGTLTVEPFELFRTIVGRRSAQQIRNFDWSVDPADYIDALGVDLFTVRSEDLIE